MIRIACFSLVAFALTATSSSAQMYYSEGNRDDGGTMQGYGQSGQFYSGNSYPGGSVTVYDNNGGIHYGQTNSLGQTYLYGQ